MVKHIMLVALVVAATAVYFIDRYRVARQLTETDIPPAAIQLPAAAAPPLEALIPPTPPTPAPLEELNVASLETDWPAESVCNQTEQMDVKWTVFSVAVEALNRLGAPYNLHQGTLLNYYRDCALNDRDVDIAIRMDWWQLHYNELNQTLQRLGFVDAYPGKKLFGEIDTLGFEESWIRNGTRVDFFSKVEMVGKYKAGLSILEGGTWTVHNCYTHRQGYTSTEWNGLKVRVPVPVVEAVEANYGADWAKPFPGSWRWAVEPFIVGDCENNVGKLQDHLG